MTPASLFCDAKKFNVIIVAVILFSCPHFFFYDIGPDGIEIDISAAKQLGFTFLYNDSFKAIAE
jgi:hypothetical protein